MHDIVNTYEIKEPKKEKKPFTWKKGLLIFVGILAAILIISQIIGANTLLRFKIIRQCNINIFGHYYSPLYIKSLLVYSSET